MRRVVDDAITQIHRLAVNLRYIEFATIWFERNCYFLEALPTSAAGMYGAEESHHINGNLLTLWKTTGCPSKSSG